MRRRSPPGPKPGQFVILKANETGERIPLTMAETDPQAGTITVIYQVVGASTRLFKSLAVGQGYDDIIGPLGKPTHIEKVGTVICVGGGTGVAVLHPITRALQAGRQPRYRHYRRAHPRSADSGGPHARRQPMSCTCALTTAPTGIMDL